MKELRPKLPGTNIGASFAIPKYSKYHPKINLEILSKKAANRMLMHTYTSFLICLIIYLVYLSYQLGPSNQINSPLQCSSCANSSSHSFYEKYYDLQFVFGFKTDVSQTNFTDLVGWSNGSKIDVCSKVSLTYDVILYGCYQSSDCYSFSSSEKNSDTGVWHVVYSNFQSNFNTDMCSLSSADSVSVELIPYSFQNQGSVSGVPTIKAYLLNVTYYNNPSLLFVPVTPAATQSISYDFQIVSATYRQAFINSIITFICILITTYCFYIFCTSLVRHEPDYSKWLPEQCWTLWYLIFVVLFLNPLYCGLVWVPSSVSASSAFASNVIRNFGFAGILTVKLCFSYPLGYREQSTFLFLGTRIAFFIILFTFMVTVSIYLFPTLVYSLHYGPFENIRSWPENDIHAFRIFSTVVYVLVWSWFFVNIIQMILTRYKLKNYPYMTNRYLHLSFRYYTIQGFLVSLWIMITFIYAVLIAASAIVNSNNTLSSLDAFAIIGLLSFNSNSNYSVSIFFSIYGIILSVIYIPLSQSNDYNNLTSKLASTYVITESERTDIIKKRKKVVKHLNMMQKSLLNNVTNFNPYVCCIDKAINLCGVSFEVYFDQPGQPTAAGLGHDENDLKDMDLESLGYEYIALNNDECHDTFCIIARHKETRKLLIAFRGTSSGKNWNDNAKYTQVPLLLHLQKPNEPLPSPFITPNIIKNQSNTLHTNLEAGINKISTESEKNDEIIENINVNFENHYLAVFDADLENLTEENQSVASKASSTSMTHDVKPQVIFTTVLGAATIVADTVYQANEDLASQAPGLKSFFEPHVHKGFYEAYMTSREFVHKTVRAELSKELSDIVITGHSLGGALGALCALDIQLHTLNPINQELKIMTTKQKLNKNLKGTNKSKNKHQLLDSNVKDDKSLYIPSRLHLSLYSYGSPKVGNSSWVKMYNEAVQETFRIVVDGDVVPAVPPFKKYVHVGTEVLIDGLGDSGSIIVSPSYVEKKLIQKTKSSVLGHLLGAYKNGLTNIKDVTQSEIMKIDTNIDNDKKSIPSVPELKRMDSIQPSDVALSAFKLDKQFRKSFYHLTAIREDE